jgi:hypothetical protein
MPSGSVTFGDSNGRADANAYFSFSELYAARLTSEYVSAHRAEEPGKADRQMALPRFKSSRLHSQGLIKKLHTLSFDVCKCALCGIPHLYFSTD